MSVRVASGVVFVAAIAGCEDHPVPGIPWGDASRMDVPWVDARPDVSAVDVGGAEAPRDAPMAAMDAVPDAPDDLPTPDAVVTDVRLDVATDAAPYDPCAAGMLRDLDALGTRVGETTTVFGDNLSAGAAPVLPSTCAVGFAGYQVVYRYTPRRSTRLQVSTNYAATDARLDTVVFALRTCAALDGGASSIGCSDDTGNPPRDHATTFVTDTNVVAGVAVYVVVAGFLHATHDLWDSQGRFELTVTEQ